MNKKTLSLTLGTALASSLMSAAPVIQAGHDLEPSGLIIDTHGQNAIEPVWDLLAEAYRCFGMFPTLVERDSNIPPLPELMIEVERIRTLQRSDTNCLRPQDISGVAA